MTAESPMPALPAVTDARGWLAVLSLAFGAFAMVTSTFLPVGLLTEIGTDLHVSPGTVGFLVSVPGLTAALSAPALTILAGRLDRRVVLLLLTAAICLSDLIVGFADSYAQLLAGRIMLGVCVGGMWSFAVASGRRLVSVAHGSRATALLFAGISLGMVCGVPAGAATGLIGGWRAAFLVAAAVAAVALAAQMLALRPLPVRGAVRLRDMLGVLRIAQVRTGLGVSALLSVAHFTGYPYLKVLLTDLAGMQPSAITLVLVVYGLSGLVGNFAGERAVTRWPKGALAGTALLLGATMSVAPWAAADPVAATVLVAAWGGAFGSVPVTIQSWIYRAAPDRFEIGSAINVVIFQSSVAFGAALGGVLVDGPGIASAMLGGGAVALATVLFIAVFAGRPAPAG